MSSALKTKRRLRRAARTRCRLNAVGKTRITVCRSNQHFYAQLIKVEGKSHRVLCFTSTRSIKDSGLTKVQQAERAGELMGQQLVAMGCQTDLAFDRSGYKYHGRVKAFAEALRAKGVQI